MGEWLDGRFIMDNPEQTSPPPNDLRTQRIMLSARRLTRYSNWLVLTCVILFLAAYGRIILPTLSPVWAERLDGFLQTVVFVAGPAAALVAIAVLATMLVLGVRFRGWVHARNHLALAILLTPVVGIGVFYVPRIVLSDMRRELGIDLVE